MKILDKEKLAQKIEARVENDLQQQNVGGVSLLVAQNGVEIYKNHFGSVSVNRKEKPTDSTMFRLASMTKPVTGVATMILCDRGKLSIDDEVAHYLPAYAAPYVIGQDGTRQEVGNKLTIKHLLTHTSGIGSGAVAGVSAGKLIPADIRSIDSYVSFFSKEPLSFVPGTRAEYSGTAAFAVLASIVQKVADVDLADFFKKEIFDPCGMVDTTFDPTAEQWGRMIEMYDKKEGQGITGKTYAGCVFENSPPSNPQGGAGLASTLADYNRFAHMLLREGESEGGRILTREAVRLMSTPQIGPEIQGGKQRWGLSMRVITSETYERLPVGAYGWSGAYGTHFWVDPVHQIVAVYMKNSKYDGGSGALTSANFERDVAAALQG